MGSKASEVLFYNMNKNGYTKKHKGGFPIGNTASPNSSPDKMKIERIADGPPPSFYLLSGPPAIMIDDSD